MIVGLSIDPSITQHAYALWYGTTLVEADLFRYVTRGSIYDRSRAIAEALCKHLKYTWVDTLDWVCVEDQIIRPRSPYNQAIMTLKTAADTVANMIAERFAPPEESCRVRLVLPEGWKGSMSKQATEMLLMGDAFGRPGLLPREQHRAIILPECHIPFRQRSGRTVSDGEKKTASDVFDAIGIGRWYIKNVLPEWVLPGEL